MSFFSGNPLFAIARRCVCLFSQTNLSEVEFIRFLRQVIPLDQARRLASSQDIFLRLGAICLLRHLPPEAAVDALITAMRHDQSPLVRLAAFEALIQRNELRVLDAAQSLVDDGHPLVRAWVRDVLVASFKKSE